MNLRKLFSAGRMNKDSDERTLSEGEYVDASNILVTAGEDGNFNAVKNSLSNKKITNVNFGTNIYTIGGFEDETRNKLYWLVKSDVGCWLLEYDRTNNVLFEVLKDTRTGSARVLNLSEKNICTAISKIYRENGDLLLISDDNIEPLCINIERAKSYGENNFEKEDIYLIKKPPFFAPTTQFMFSDTFSNNLEEKFPLFAYRYKYLDGEYSALSSFTVYKFSPKQFQLDYEILDNNAMLNAYGSIRVGFNTGDKRVTDIQVVFKESNSNSIYLIDTINKKDKSYLDNEIQYITYSANKIYTVLPEKELYRTFDNVPRKAEAMTVIDNAVVFGNYLEGYNIEKQQGVKTIIDFEAFAFYNVLDNGDDMIFSYSGSVLSMPYTQEVELKKDYKITFYFNINNDETDTLSYEKFFDYILPADFDTLDQIWATDDFQNFISIISLDFQSNYVINGLPSGWIVNEQPIVSSSYSSGSVRISISDAEYIDESDVIHNVSFSHTDLTVIGLNEISISSSIHSNSDVETALIYIDAFGRQTIPLICESNTIHIPHKQSVTQNKVGLKINHAPPYWAVAYKVAVKTNPLIYQTIFITTFFNEDAFVWCKLEGENKDKVKPGDYLILKVAAELINEKPIKIKVLEVESKEKDFITGNKNDEGKDIVEPAGMYMKIKPVGFNMNSSDSIIKVANGSGSTNKRGLVFLDLFTEFDDTTPVDIAIPQGSQIELFFESHRKKSGSWYHSNLNKTFYAQRNYNNIEEFIEEVYAGKPIFANEGNNPEGNHNNGNYGVLATVIRGIPNKIGNKIISITPNSNGKLWLRQEGTQYGTGSHDGYLRIKLTLRVPAGLFVFETSPKRETVSNLFYQSEETFLIEDGKHLGNIQNQNISTFTPAEVLLNFYNCFSFGNGVESYKIKDGFNTNFLNIDMKPSAASIEEYREIRRYSDLTHSEEFVESSNINGINVFNLSQGNFTELDKQFGPVHKLLSRDTDVVVLQEHKASKVLVKKDVVTNSDGSGTMVAISSFFGKQITYMGENGIGNARASVAQNDFQIYYLNPNRGTPIRLSIDGTTPINYGLTNWWRSLFVSNPKGKKIGGYDPFHQRYIVSIDENIEDTLETGCGTVLEKRNQTSAFNYLFKLNKLDGEIVLNYNITEGNATIEAAYASGRAVVSNVNGLGSLIIDREGNISEKVLVKVTPVTEKISYTIENNCPVGNTLKVVEIVLNSPEDDGKNIINRYRWGSSPFYSSDDLFTVDEVSKFNIQEGIEGQGKFPLDDSLINIQSFKTDAQSGQFKLTECHAIGYLVTNEIYEESDIETILSEATFLELEETGTLVNKTVSGNFLFNKTASDDILYLIWDYRNKKPILLNDEVTIGIGGSATIPIIANDTFADGSTINIVTNGENGVAVLNSDNTITYTHTAETALSDTITYSVTSNGCTATAIIKIRVSEETPSLFRYFVNKKTSEYNCGDTTTLAEIYVNIQPLSTSDWFSNVTQIFLDEAGTIPAPAGWYIDNALVVMDAESYTYIHWNGSAIVGADEGTCPY